MGIIRGTKKALKPLVNFPKWMDTRRVAESAGVIAGLIKHIFTPRKAKRKETFETAIKRLKLTEEILKERQKEFKRLYILFIIISFLALAYTIDLFFSGYIRAGLIAIVISGVALVQIFRYHFWFFQIRKRKLGCTFSEWFKQGLFGLSK